MADKYKNYTAGLTSAPIRAAAVVPNDSTDLPDITRGIVIGGAGDLTVTMLGGDTVTFTLVAGVTHPMRLSRIHSTGTTATNIVAVW